MPGNVGSVGAPGGRAPLVTPSAELAAVIGADALTRSEAVRKIWDYINANGLQDQANKRVINADAKLGRIFGGRSQVSTLELNTLLSKNLSR